MPAPGISAVALCASWYLRTVAYGQTAPVERYSSPDQKEEGVAEAVIRKRVEDLAKAVHAKDIDGVMSFMRPISFPSTSPRRCDTPALNVTTAGGLAFVHSVNHVKGSLVSGHSSDMWVRWTACFRRIDGVWLVVHDHVSVPADLEHGQALPEPHALRSVCRFDVRRQVNTGRNADAGNPQKHTRRDS